MSDNSLKVVVFLGTVREMRMADRVSKLVCGELSKRGHQVTVLDPVEKKLELLVKAFHHYKDPSTAPPLLQEMDAVIRGADAFVVITAEYNRSIPPALSNMLDYFSPKSYSYRPCSIVSYSPSGFGGCVAAVSLRTLMGELSCLVLPAIASIAEVYKTVDENGKTESKGVQGSLTVTLDQLEYVAKAMKAAKSTLGEPPKAQPYL